MTDQPPPFANNHAAPDQSHALATRMVAVDAPEDRGCGLPRDRAFEQEVGIGEGPLSNDDGESAGSLIIVRVDTAHAVCSLIAPNPFYSERVWSDVEILRFKVGSGTLAAALGG